MANFGTEFQEGLRKAGLQPIQYKPCIEWAFGLLLQKKMKTEAILQIWEERHGNLFSIFADDNISDSAYKIAKAWLSLKPDFDD